MTENEAKTKWCPMTHARYEILEEKTDFLGEKYRTVVEIHDTTCLASKCMMWVSNKPDDGFCGLTRGATVVLPPIKD